MQKNKNDDDVNQEDFEEDISLNTGSGFFKKILIILIFLIILFIISLFILQNVINLSNRKIQINNELKSLILLETGELNKDASFASINGNIAFRSFFLPHVVINDITGNNLIEKEYKLNFTIKTIKLFLSISDLLQKKTVINKIEIIDGNFNLKQFNNDSDNKIITNILNNYFKKTISQTSNVELILNNNNITIDTNILQRELSKINLKTIYSPNQLQTTGSLLSNKQPLNTNLIFNIKKDDWNGVINLTSQAFIGNIDLKMNTIKNEFEGKINVDLINPQLFTRTIFNSTNFLYKRIIDNTNLKFNFDFSFKNKEFLVNKINFDGKNLKAKGDLNFNFNFEKNNKNYINFDIDFIDIDNLMIKNFTGKNTNINEKNIEIFSNNKIETNISEDLELQTNIDTILNKNLNYFDIKIKSLQINQDKISNTELKFSYEKNDGFKFDKISSELPGKTNLLISNQENKEIITVKGEKFWDLLSFLRSSNNEKNEELKKHNFDFNGELIIIKNKLFINNINFKLDDFESTNKIEVDFNNGISYLAIMTNINKFILDDDLINKNTSPTNRNIFKNKILFLNNFTLNTFLKFNIKNIQYKDFKDKNYNFIIKTSQGLLNIYNLNLNNKINGNINFDILTLKPTINANLTINNFNILNNIDLNSFIFWLPTFEDFYGNINLSVNNLKFRNSIISNGTLLTKLNNGILNIDTLKFDGFGGKCAIDGFLELKYNRKMNIRFNGCTGDLGELLYIFTDINTITGLIGYSAVLYAEGFNLENFIQNYMLKLQLVGSGIKIKEFGISNLSSELFDINSNEELSSNIKPEETIYNKKLDSIFTKMSGDINYSKKQGGQLNLDISKSLINGKINGTFDIHKNFINLALNSTFILLSGTLEKTLPLTLIIGIAGNTSDKLNVAINLQQINSYIQSVRDRFEEIKLENEKNNP